MALGNASETSLMELLFQNTTWAAIANAVSSGILATTTAGSFWIQLSTGTLTGSSNQSTTEAAYTSYARQAVARSSGAWSVSGNAPCTASNAAAINFPQATGGTETETYFSVGTSASGAGTILWYGALTSSLAVSNGITPSFAIGALTCTLT
jgi:hypothetical protein